MAKLRKAVQATPLGAVRASLGRAQAKGERILARVRRDAEAFVARSRGEVVREVRDLERRLLKTLHAATRERVARLERRVAKLEDTVAEMRRPGSTREKAA